MPSWQHHISRQSSEKPRWKNLVGAPPLSCALRPQEKGHPNASSRTHWILNIDLMSSFVKPVPNLFEHFQMRFRPFGPCQDICHHGEHPKNQPCLLEIDYCVSPICDDVKWPNPDLPGRPPFAVPPDAPAAVAKVQTRMPKMVVKGDKGLQVKPCSW